MRSNLEVEGTEGVRFVEGHSWWVNRSWGCDLGGTVSKVVIEGTHICIDSIISLRLGADVKL